MAETPKNTLKQWFVTGAKPQQAQYWAWLDSYWHKSEAISINTIDGLGQILVNKADADQLALYAKKDASNLSESDIISWKAAIGSGGSGLSTVKTNETLTGDGSEDNPIGLSEEHLAIIGKKLDTVSTTSQTIASPITFFQTATIPKIILTTQTSNTTVNAVWSDGTWVYFNGAGGTPKTLAFNGDKIDKPNQPVNDDGDFNRMIFLDYQGFAKFLIANQTSQRLLSFNNGAPNTDIYLEEEFETDSDIIAAIKSAAYSNSIGNISLINKTFRKGKKYVDSETGLLYVAFLDNFIIRK